MEKTHVNILGAGKGVASKEKKRISGDFVRKIRFLCCFCGVRAAVLKL